MEPREISLGLEIKLKISERIDDDLGMTAVQIFMMEILGVALDRDM